MLGNIYLGTKLRLVPRNPYLCQKLELVQENPFDFACVSICMFTPVLFVIDICAALTVLCANVGT